MDNYPPGAPASEPYEDLLFRYINGEISREYFESHYGYVPYSVVTRVKPK